MPARGINVSVSVEFSSWGSTWNVLLPCSFAPGTTFISSSVKLPRDIGLIAPCERPPESGLDVLPLRPLSTLIMSSISVSSEPRPSAISLYVRGGGGQNVEVSVSVQKGGKSTARGYDDGGEPDRARSYRARSSAMSALLAFKRLSSTRTRSIPGSDRVARHVRPLARGLCSDEIESSPRRKDRRESR